MSKIRRKTRSDKFPLTLHPTGQYCKKINGKLYYFGADKKPALEKYLNRATCLHGDQRAVQKKTNGDVTLKQLCDLYLKYQLSKVQANGLTARHHNEQINSLSKLMFFLGPSRKINEISTLDLQSYRRQLQRKYSTAHRMNLHISIMKAMFHWAKKNDILDYILNIDTLSCVKVIHKQRHVFTSEQIHQLFDFADVQMKAMIWLGLNCSFGCTDCAELKWSDLDLVNSRVKLARGKTGVSRDLPLWPETIQALENIPKSGKLVFSSAGNKPLIRATCQINKDGYKICTGCFKAN